MKFTTLRISVSFDFKEHSSYYCETFYAKSPDGLEGRFRIIIRTEDTHPIGFNTLCYLKMWTANGWTDLTDDKAAGIEGYVNNYEALPIEKQEMTEKVADQFKLFVNMWLRKF